jgi:hypothetical protein
MKPILILSAMMLAAPVLAQTHEPLTGALAGRSPHVPMRQIAAAPTACDAVRASVPSGKHPAAKPHCTIIQTAERLPAGPTALGR